MEFPEGSIESFGGYVQISWSTGRVQKLSAPFLRAVCQCAECGNLSIQIEAKMFPGLQVERINLVGSYAFQFYFSDGHHDGAFPYDMLLILPDDM